MHEFGFQAETILDLFNVHVDPEVTGVSYGNVNIWEQLP